MAGHELDVITYHELVGGRGISIHLSNLASLAFTSRQTSPTHRAVRKAHVFCCPPKDVPSSLSPTCHRDLSFKPNQTSDTSIVANEQPLRLMSSLSSLSEKSNPKTLFTSFLVECRESGLDFPLCFQMWGILEDESPLRMSVP